jgi:glucose/arabinose dehydrogenase
VVIVPAATSAGSRLGLATVATGFRQPVQVVVAPGEPDHLYVVERAGRVRVVEDGKVKPRPFLDIRTRVRSGGLIGLLSIVFHPRYATERRAYAMYTTPVGNLVVQELRVRDGRARPVRVVFRVRVSTSLYAHVGGQLAFRAGRLYASIGDGLDPAAAQDPAQPLGKILRLDVDPPFAPPQIVVLGLRNPWRFSFDRLTGDLFIGDPGEDRWEEIDVVRRGASGVPNFGWDAYEGRAPRENAVSPPPEDAVAPFLEYPNPRPGCAAVIGGFVYRGHEIPVARGRYFFGDTCSGRVWSVRAGATSPTPRQEPFKAAQLASFGEDAAGELYLVLRGDGAVVRLVNR